MSANVGLLGHSNAEIRHQNFPPLLTNAGPLPAHQHAFVCVVTGTTVMEVQADSRGVDN